VQRSVYKDQIKLWTQSLKDLAQYVAEMIFIQLPIIVCPMLCMDRIEIYLCVCVCVCIHHTFCQLTYRSDPLNPYPLNPNPLSPLTLTR